MSDKEKKKWNYKEGEGRYGWFDDYLYPGEHHGQVSHRAAVAKNRINKVANDTGLKRERVKHMYDIHKYDDQPGEPTATSIKAQQKYLDTRKKLEKAFKTKK